MEALQTLKQKCLMKPIKSFTDLAVGFYEKHFSIDFFFISDEYQYQTGRPLGKSDEEIRKNLRQMENIHEIANKFVSSSTNSQLYKQN